MLKTMKIYLSLPNNLEAEEGQEFLFGGQELYPSLMMISAKLNVLTLPLI